METNSLLPLYHGDGAPRCISEVDEGGVPPLLKESREELICGVASLSCFWLVMRVRLGGPVIVQVLDDYLFRLSCFDVFVDDHLESSKHSCSIHSLVQINKVYGDRIRVLSRVCSGSVRTRKEMRDNEDPEVKHELEGM
ncbi:hypothetical protein Bca52824_068527 [Brassica carinata]|uniref:Uncharacterized protein n=1 Tax=Brassica carinata TaxID=52824 RepID=A0A8X7Q1Z8_BRACI|nr:hypothetical protein Bca52824_068527 [Brassica carinata]